MEILRLSLLGGLLGLDATGVGQFMVSRPLVAGAIAGLVVGDPGLGLTIGAVLELYLLVSFPSGGASFPEGATATVVAVASAAPFHMGGALPLAVAVGLIWGQVGAMSITGFRRLNARVVPEPGDPISGPGSVSRAHAVGIGIDFVRGVAVTWLGVALGRMVVGALAPAWPLATEASTGLLLVGGMVSAGVLLRDLGGFRRRGRWLVAGLAASILGSGLL